MTTTSIRAALLGKSNAAKKIAGLILKAAGFVPVSKTGLWKAPTEVIRDFARGADDDRIAVSNLIRWAGAALGLDEAEIRRILETRLDRAVEAGQRALSGTAETPETPETPHKTTEEDDMTTATGSLDKIIEKIAARAAVEAVKEHGVDESVVRRIAREEVAAVNPILVSTPDSPEKVRNLGAQHEKFADLLAWSRLGRPVLLYGPAGSGKTTAGRKLAEALGYEALVLHLGPQTTQSSIFGYFDATGRYVDTPFRRAYEGTGEFENGAVIVLDELDRCNPRVSVTLNGGIENGRMTFPDREVQRADKVIIIACANTALSGADRTYNSAQQQDGAFRDRFIFLRWDYDEKLEERLALAWLKGVDDEEIAGQIRDWLVLVRAVRRQAGEANIDIVVSPRASITGCSALALGIPPRKLPDAVLFRGAENNIREKLVQLVRARAGNDDERRAVDTFLGDE